MPAYETIVVGAGAAGLIAAGRSAECGQRTLLLEKNPRPGTKILMSGGTRCNITHATDARGIVQAFADQGSFLHSALAALPPDEVVALVEARNVPTKVEPGGKIFPVSDRAQDVLRALQAFMHDCGAEMALSEPLDSVTQNDKDGGFVLQTPQRRLTTERLILTTGGKSYPGSGTTGDGYAWLKEMGHTIRQPRPALTPITSNDSWLHQLKGLTISDVGLRLERADNKSTLDTQRGSFLFTHFGISGPIALNISRHITAAPDQTLQLRCDFYPSNTAEQLDEELKGILDANGKKQLLTALNLQLPGRMASALLSRLGLDVESRAAELSKRDRRAIIESLKDSVVSVSGTRGFKKAEVTAGGLALEEVDSRTMESKLVPGLFIAGELLDLDGPIGGYNFQAAFSTGYLAGQTW